MQFNFVRIFGSLCMYEVMHRKPEMKLICMLRYYKGIGGDTWCIYCVQCESRIEFQWDVCGKVGSLGGEIGGFRSRKETQGDEGPPSNSIKSSESSRQTDRQTDIRNPLGCTAHECCHRFKLSGFEFKETVAIIKGNCFVVKRN